MANLKATLEKTGVKAYRLICKVKNKPRQYYTFQRITRRAECAADDEISVTSDIYRVTIFSKQDFEQLLDDTVENLKKAGYTVQSVDTELYETETGYFMAPVNIQILKE